MTHPKRVTVDLTGARRVADSLLQQASSVPHHVSMYTANSAALIIVSLADRVALLERAARAVVDAHTLTEQTAAVIGLESVLDGDDRREAGES